MSDKVYDKICTCCDRKYKSKSRNKRLCPDCAAQKLEKRKKKTRAGYKKPHAAKKAPRAASATTASKKPDVRKCKACFYSARLSNNTTICDYILLVGHRRPCPPGAECTCYKEKK